MSKKRRTIRVIGYYDPDPNPGSLLVWAIVGLIALFLWTNPNAINNIMLMLNPQLAKLEEEKIKAQMETLRYILLMVLAVCGVVLLIYLSERKKRKRMM